MLLQEVASLPVCCIPYLCVVSNRKDRELGFGNFVLALCLFGAVAGLNYWIITAITAQKQKDADEESVASNEPVHLASSSSAGSDSDCSYPSLEQSDTPPDDSDSSTSSSSDGSDFRASLRACFLKSFVFLKGFLKSFLENFLKRVPIPSTLAVRSALRELTHQTIYPQSCDCLPHCAANSSGKCTNQATSPVTRLTGSQVTHVMPQIVKPKPKSFSARTEEPPGREYYQKSLCRLVMAYGLSQFERTIALLTFTRAGTPYMAAAERARLADAIEMRTFAAGEVVVTQGEELSQPPAVAAMTTASLDGGGGNVPLDVVARVRVQHARAMCADESAHHDGSWTMSFRITLCAFTVIVLATKILR